MVRVTSTGGRLLRRGVCTEGRVSTAAAELAAMFWGVVVTRLYVQQVESKRPITFYTDSQRVVDMMYGAQAPMWC